MTLAEASSPSAGVAYRPGGASSSAMDESSALTSSMSPNSWPRLKRTAMSRLQPAESPTCRRPSSLAKRYLWERVVRARARARREAVRHARGAVSAGRALTRARGPAESAAPRTDWL